MLNLRSKRESPLVFGFWRPVGANIVAQLVRIVSTLAILLVLTRRLTLGELGGYLLAQSLAISGARVFEFGLARAVVPYSVERNGPIGRALMAATQAMLLNYLIFGAVHVVFSLVLLRGVSSGLIGGLAWVFLVQLWGVSIGLSQVWAEVYRAHGRDYAAGVFHGVSGGALAGVFSLLLIVALSLLDRLTGTSAAVAGSAAVVMSVLVAALTTGRPAGRPVPFAEVRSLARVGRPAGFSQMVVFGVLESPIWAATLAFGEAGSAPLILARRLAAQASMLPHVFANTISVDSYRSLLSERRSAHLSRVAMWFSVLGIVSLGSLIVVVAYPSIVAGVLGRDLRGVGAYLAFFAAPSVVMSVLGAPGHLVQMSERARQSAWIATIIGGGALMGQATGVLLSSEWLMIGVFATASISMITVDYLILRRYYGFDRSPLGMVLGRWIRLRPPAPGEPV